MHRADPRWPNSTGEYYEAIGLISREQRLANIPPRSPAGRPAILTDAQFLEAAASVYLGTLGRARFTITALARHLELTMETPPSIPTLSSYASHYGGWAGLTSKLQEMYRS